jgi:hypothetical protein
MSSLDMYGIIKVFFSVNDGVGALVIWCAPVFCLDMPSCILSICVVWDAATRQA